MKKIFILVLLLFSSILSDTVSAADVTLAWDANTDASVTGYKLYYGNSTRSYGTPINVGKVTQYKITGISNTNLFWAVTAYSAIAESAYSVELPTFTLIPSITGSGTITPSVPIVVSNITPQTFIMTPSTGYYLSGLKIDGITVTPVNTYTFTNPTNTHTIAAVFSAVPVILPVTGLKIIGN
jgi:hypothetical protein